MNNQDINPITEQEKMFPPLSINELIEVLGSTVKRDNTNKLITFLCQLAAFTDDGQFNVSFNAPSSSGKSYIPMEIARYFPKEDVIKLGTCSPRAFYHEQGKYDKATNTIRVDLERKIIVFLDQPDLRLLKELRSLLSHDDKEIQSKITDKAQKGGNITKTVIIRGYPSVIFCSAWLTIDEQEGTRFILLSPETDQEKIYEAVQERIRKETDKESYDTWLNQHSERQLLKDRILTIKNENVTDVKIPSPEKIRDTFLGSGKILQPRNTRDVGRVISFVKALALLNLWSRKRVGSVIVANDNDIAEALKLWNEIAVSQELNLPPHTFNIFRETIVPAWKEKGWIEGTATQTEKFGLLRNEIFRRHIQVYGRSLPDWMLRQQVIPSLENAGLIEQRQLPSNRKNKLVCPPPSSTIFKEKEIVSESVGEERLSEHQSTDMTSEAQ